MKKILFFVGLMLIALFSGCATAPRNQKYMADPLYCEAKLDCTKQATACCSCGCPKAINIYNTKSLFCLPCTNSCMLECPMTSATCDLTKNQCKLVEINLQDVRP